MSDERRPEDDPGADTQMFRAFVDRPDRTVTEGPVGARFRILTLLAGLAVFVAVVWVLLRA